MVIECKFLPVAPTIQYEEVKATIPMPSKFIKIALHQCHRMLNQPRHSEIDGEEDVSYRKLLELLQTSSENCYLPSYFDYFFNELALTNKL